jgi:heme oxygenase (biliverdin-IX-beta and delta-forming)
VRGSSNAVGWPGPPPTIAPPKCSTRYRHAQKAETLAMINEVSARAALRAGTGSHHERVDRLFSAADLSDRASYGRFLQAQAAAHLAVERALVLRGVGAIVTDWPIRERGTLLCADLDELGLAIPDPIGIVVLDNEASLLGGLYVLEGSRLGGTLLKRSVPATFPTRFLGGGTSSSWQGCRGAGRLRRVRAVRKCGTAIPRRWNDLINRGDRARAALPVRLAAGSTVPIAHATLHHYRSLLQHPVTERRVALPLIGGE